MALPSPNMASAIYAQTICTYNVGLRNGLEGLRMLVLTRGLGKAGDSEKQGCCLHPEPRALPSPFI